MNEFIAPASTCIARSEERQRGRWHVARDCIVGLAVALVCQTALAQAMYRIKPLGYLPGCNLDSPIAEAFNKADQVAGDACTASGDTHAFLWTDDGKPMVDLGPDEPGSQSYATALNASGLVTGYVQDSMGNFAFLSSGNGTPMTRLYNPWGGSEILPAAVNDLGQLAGSANIGSEYHAFVWKNDGSPILDLGTLAGGSSFGLDINSSGQVAGWSASPGDTLSHHAFIWRNDGTPIVDLGKPSEGMFINASGQIAGVLISSSTTGPVKVHAFFWRNDGTPIQDLHTLGGPYSDPFAFNDAGQMAGSSYTHTPGDANKHAFAWMNDGTPMKDLGTLGGASSNARAINASGQVTGWAVTSGNAAEHAFLWRNDGTNIQDLNTLIDPTDPLKRYVTLTSGDFINDYGDIVADGTDSRTGLGDLYLLKGTVLTLSPRSLAFGNQKIKTTSAAKSVTMTNTSPKATAITSIVLTGTAAGQFAQTNNCGKSLAGHATCAVKVTFNPTTKGAKSATLNVNGGGGGLRTVTLTGTGT